MSTIEFMKTRLMSH